MSDRGRGRGGQRGSRGGPGGRGGGPNSGSREDKPKKESILDLSKYTDKKIRVKFNGGREIIGILKGYDPLLNLVLDDVEEHIRVHDPETEEWKLSDSTRSLGLVVIRGPALILISPLDGMEEIANPFASQE